jgi:hypothetical protein
MQRSASPDGATRFPAASGAVTQARPVAPAQAVQARGLSHQEDTMIHINNSSESHTAASAACGAVSGEQIEASRQYDVDTAQAGGRICPDCWAWYLAYHCRRDCRGALMFQGGHDSFGCPTPGSTPGERRVAWLRLQNCQQHAHDQPYGQVRAPNLD